MSRCSHECTTVTSRQIFARTDRSSTRIVRDKSGERTILTATHFHWCPNTGTRYPRSSISKGRSRSHALSCAYGDPAGRWVTEVGFSWGGVNSCEKLCGKEGLLCRSGAMIWQAPLGVEMCPLHSMGPLTFLPCLAVGF